MTDRNASAACEATFWAKADHALKFSKSRTALLLIDPVNDVLSEGGTASDLTKTTVQMHDVIGPEAVQVTLSVSPRVDRDGQLVRAQARRTTHKINIRKGG